MERKYPIGSDAWIARQTRLWNTARNGVEDVVPISLKNQTDQAINFPPSYRESLGRMERAWNNRV
ncbi:hypothetical protein A3H85_02735 [Candidatus Daviesbacteria bacterium RIFCSPLOWO2_02_FULL_40_8]|uniref:Uncharacterized protein n=1 Tax=Candidatus Daviesbacteria bacterium RIFCSPLOWO2_01_FULL_40_24 TaxID=1797787 RepID=A0A1F5MII1_9BACT|nr:MAG: hypothetical protein A2780_03460 [Candidatus Daviesbacteria bacterium RIFCSPHIGHO2_01_FULL_41_45]OGE34202.1 MAG: hypothetical protein A3C32_00545 [Candidatus Daviesbacteria bacterium RIFCSPHIGHO2_02_FULL_41_14]OGE65186.1 MAG: hypothetical protein A3B49_01495 [Candidatus Daviesbacteria bacterium RIFCSPLOWO2_01_FULL_40_24]OGE66889.1 MAG: hypothetical protein A3H85_02735 [Candidatus Daviesbacteria bacterium RIFCSPLOWO2_02_FULL_40_8]